MFAFLNPPRRPLRSVRVLRVGSNGAQVDRVQRRLESSTSTPFDVMRLGRLSGAPSEPAAREFDVLLLDLGDAHAVAVLREAQELFPGIPVVLEASIRRESPPVSTTCIGPRTSPQRSPTKTGRLPAGRRPVPDRKGIYAVPLKWPPPARR